MLGCQHIRTSKSVTTQLCRGRYSFSSVCRVNNTKYNTRGWWINSNQQRLQYLGYCTRKRRFTTVGSRRSFCSSSSSKNTTLLQWYSSMLDKYPLLTKGITSGFIAGLGDVLCQYMNSWSEYDWKRTFRFGFLGSCYIAPGCHVWYNVLAKSFPLSAATAASSSTMMIVMKRVFCDQILFSPVFLVGWMTVLWNLEDAMNTDSTIDGSDNNNDSNSEITSDYIDRMVATLPNILIANWLLWIPVQTINFKYVPTKYLVLVSNCVALIWNGYLSYATSRPAKLNDDTAIPVASKKR